ncbi:hypothetical protein NDU88_005940 [Pleurodeles waltl]|uniref:Uncharacterized protein n=1 Tax=Pleurodeles waltl TaxID=8319 RepID=A0AAV7UMH5_PLEWA|nr:hypothetical protein NDU88_005940 [Pleurodeles waltl]
MSVRAEVCLPTLHLFPRSLARHTEFVLTLDRKTDGFHYGIVILLHVSRSPRLTCSPVCDKPRLTHSRLAAHRPALRRGTAHTWLNLCTLLGNRLPHLWLGRRSCSYPRAEASGNLRHGQIDRREAPRLIVLDKISPCQAEWTDHE